MRICMLLPQWETDSTTGRSGPAVVVDALVDELGRRGLEVDTIVPDADASGPSASGNADAIPTAALHIAHALAMASAREYDIVHDHNGVLGALAGMFSGDRLPPMLHTLHDDLTSVDEPSNIEERAGAAAFYREVARAGDGWFAASLTAQLEAAPYELRQRIVTVAPAGIASRAYPFVGFDRCGDHIVCCGPIDARSAQHVAARVAHRSSSQLVLAGAVGGHRNRRAVLRACATDPAQQSPAVSYFRRNVLPYVDERHVCYVGDPAGRERLEYLAHARAMVCTSQSGPATAIDALEALACGVPVIGTRHGVLTEIVEDGMNGFLVDDEDGLCEAVGNATAIDRADCRRSVEERFSPEQMADRYLEAYRHIQVASRDRVARNSRTRRASSSAIAQSGHIDLVANL